MSAVLRLPLIHLDKGGAARFYKWIFFCCTRPKLATHAPMLLHTFRRYCTRSDVATHAPMFLHRLPSNLLCTFLTAAHTLRLLHTLPGCCTCSIKCAAPPSSAWIDGKCIQDALMMMR